MVGVKRYKYILPQMTFANFLSMIIFREIKTIFWKKLVCNYILFQVSKIHALCQKIIIKLINILVLFITNWATVTLPFIMIFSFQLNFKIGFLSEPRGIDNFILLLIDCSTFPNSSGLCILLILWHFKIYTLGILFSTCLKIIHF